jgi:serine/threonine protein kinase
LHLHKQRSISEESKAYPKVARKESISEEKKAEQNEEEWKEMDKSGLPAQKFFLSGRYNQDFNEIEKLGQGGFGQVFKARHKLDGNLYAIKKIKLLSKNKNEENKRIMREVTYLSRLNNQNIVRYFQTWVEIETDPNIIAEFSDSEEE